MQETTHSDTVPSATESPSVQLPSAHVLDASRPPKRRKVAFSDDVVTHVASQPPQQSASNDIRPPSSRDVPLTSVHDSTSEETVALPPTISHPTSEGENLSSSAQAQTEKPRKHKRKVAKITPPGDDSADLVEDSANASRKKRKKINGASLRKETSPEAGALNPCDMNPSSDTQKKHFRKGRSSVLEIPPGT